jgi:metalloendopeptidase OMA1, mitochondrial
MQKKFKFILAALLISITACVTTPISEKSALILIPFSQELSLGAQSYGEILSKEKISQNTRLNKMIKRVGERLAAVSDMPDLDWEFKLIESPQQNAFALPGGKVAFYTGILQVCENEAGVATVMGHEIAHAIARHGAQRMTQQMLISGAVSFASLNYSNSQYKPLILGALGIGTKYGLQLPFSRANESEADEIGIVYMARAGYDPNEAVSFWSRFQSAKGNQPPEFMSTHPSDETRIERLSKLLPNALKKYGAAPVQHGTGEKVP